MRFGTLGIVIALAAAAPTLGAGQERPDGVRFGDEASEKAHALVAANAPASDGALGRRCRRLGEGGSLTFTLACDPVQQTYLTVTLWGSDQEVATLFLFDGEKRIGGYLGAWPELDLCKGEAAFPGRFYHSTYLIPKEMTQGKERVTLRVAAVGSISPYAPAERREKPLAGLTRGLYQASTHTDPFLAAEAREAAGSAPAARPRPAPEADALRDLRRQVDDALEALLRWQLYGPEWDAAVKRGDVPAVVLGACLRPMRIEKLPADAWKDRVTQRSMDGNAVAWNVPALYAEAYRSPWSRHRGKAELLDRVVKALDFCCVAQGADGCFAATRWIGAPERKVAGSCLEGFGTAGLGQAILTLAREPAPPIPPNIGGAPGGRSAAAALLDGTVDHDGDPGTPPIGRRTAYADLLAKHRDFLVSGRGRGHATNQDMAQMTAMWLANEALHALAPDRAWPREKALEYVHSAVGLRRDVLGGYWVTRKGLALEPWGTLAGGYCGNYGLMGVGQLCRLASLTGDAQVQERARAAVRAASFFFVPSTDAEGYPCMRREEVVSTRNNNRLGRVDYGGDLYAAGVLKEPLAVRALQLALAQGHTPSVVEESNAHFVAGVTGAMLSLPHLEKALALPPAAVRLPMEEGRPDFTWADEQAGVVVVKHGGDRLYASLNWRRGFRDGKRDPEHAQVNNIARIHYTTPALDRVANVAMESPHGFGKLYVCRYGPYLIGMNLSEETTYELPVPASAGPVTDLVSGEPVEAGKPLPIPPGTTQVLRM